MRHERMAGMDYQQAADEARQLVAQSEQTWWRLAELTWHQVNAGVTGDSGPPRLVSGT
jgi:hypothetical protein